METLKTKNSQIKVALIGAELKSFISNNIEYIWCSNPVYWKRSAPFLFPIVGSLKDSKTIIEGKEYKLSQHGFLRDQLFVISKKEESDTVSTLELVNTFNSNTLDIYPYKYKAVITYVLYDDKLQTNIKIINVDDKKILFNIGGHPAFNTNLYGDKFEDYKIEFETNESFSSPLVCDKGLLDFTKSDYVKENIKEIILDKQIFTIDTILINNIKSNSCKLINKQGKGIKFTFNDFNTLAIWTPYNDAPFICLEPWIGYNDLVTTDGTYESKSDLIKLNEGEEFNCMYEIQTIC